MSNRLRETQNTIYSGQPNPYLTSGDDKDDDQEPDFDSLITKEEVAYLLEHDCLVGFRCETMTEEALAYWVSTDGKEEDPSLEFKEAILDALIWAQAYGFSLVVFYDEQKDLLKPLNGTSTEFDVFHPMIDGYGIQDWTLDNRKRPIEFKIKTGPGLEDYVKVNAKRCVIVTWKRTGHDWRAPPCFLKVRRELWDYRKWRRIYGIRAGERARTRYLINKQEGNWEDDEMAETDKAFESIPHGCVSNVKVEAVSGELTDTEMESTRAGLLEAIAENFGAGIADLRGAEAGQKLSVDSNDARLARTFHKIQEWARKYVKQIFEHLGFKFKGFNPPWEVRDDLKDKEILALVDSMSRCPDKDIQEFIKGRLLNVMKDVKRATIVPTEQQQLQLEGAKAGGPGNGAVGQSASARDRDTSQTNRARKENDRVPAK